MQRPGLLSEAQLSAVKLFGARTVRIDGVRVQEPAHGSRAVRALLSLGYMQDDEVMMRIFREAGMSGAGVDLFKRNKVVARRPEAEGGGIEVQALIPGVTDDNLSEYSASTESDAGVTVTRDVRPAVVDDRKLTYKLNTIFTDVTTSDKLQISPRRLQAAKRLAVSDPAAAAASLGEYLRENGFPGARVVAGDYAKTIGRARELIRQFADTIVYKDLAAPAVMTPKDVRVTFDGFAMDGKPLWTAIGPVKYATETLHIYQLAIRYGPERVMFMLGIETAMLQINIYNEVAREYYTGTMNGYSSLAGIQPQDSSLPSELTAEQQTRLVAAAKKVSPVYIDKLVVGSAVHVSDHHVILNEHTLVDAVDADKVPELCGVPIHESRSVAHDISMVKREGRNAQWVFRQSDVGERVVLCFSVGDTVEYSEVLRVLAVHGEQIILSDSNVLRRGASGAAVVALRDSALLGIFSTSRAHNVICAAFTSATFNIVTDYMSMPSSEHLPTPGDAAGDRTYERMVKRGLLGFLEQMSDATATLYTRHSGVRRPVGLVANVSGSWLTTVNPDVAQLEMFDGKLLTFRTQLNGMFQAVAPPPVLATLPNVRTVSPGERVFLFTKSGDDVIMSSIRVVTHCMSDMRQFVVEDFGDSVEETSAALIVAEKDAAVVGLYGFKHPDAYGGSVVTCSSFIFEEPLLSAPLPSDVGTVVAELRDGFARDDGTMTMMAQLGKAVIDVVAAHRAYNGGMSIADGTQLINSEWRGRRHRVLSAFGWQMSDWASFPYVDEDLVAYAFVAMAYVRDAYATMNRLGTILVENTAIEASPVIGEFPFPRPDSATGSVSSSRERLTPFVDVGPEMRLKKLETQFSMLSEYVKRRSPEPGG